MEMETMAMTLIAHSGDARTLAFQALQAAKKHNFEEADRLIGESKKASVLAHNAQTDLLVEEANENFISMWSRVINKYFNEKNGEIL